MKETGRGQLKGMKKRQALQALLVASVTRRPLGSWCDNEERRPCLLGSYPTQR
jgi:hypothetical protein